MLDAGVDRGRKTGFIARRFVEAAADFPSQPRVEQGGAPAPQDGTQIHACVRKIGSPVFPV